MDNLKDKAIKFKWSEYVQVKDRILYLAENYAWKYSITTNYEYFKDEKMRVVKATLTIRDEEMETHVIYNWLAQEVEGTTFINKTSALENAETSAVWRACAMAGIWVIDSIASVDEINKATNRQVKKDKEIVNDTPFEDHIPSKTSKADKPTFEKEQFENLKLKKDLFDFDTARKTIHNKYNVSTDYEKMICELYWKDMTQALF